MLKRILAALTFAVSSMAPIVAQAQCVSLPAAGVAYTQNFDTLVNTGTSVVLPTGWQIAETGTNANTTYTAGTGSSTTGDSYSFGAAASTDRALGSVRSGSLVPVFGACFTNNTGTALASLNINYIGEEWRLGTAARTDQLTFEFSLDATTLATGTWTATPALNFVTPNTVTTGAKDGNAVGNRTALSATIGSLSIANGATFWIRWTDVDASGADDGLAVDDFSLTPIAAVIQPDLTVNDVSQNEGNSGITTFTFTVSLSAPAGAGGVSFDIATQNGTATAGSDYVAKSLSGQTIPQGMTTYTFTVDVNGDTIPEGNETFFVNVTNLTGANLVDGQGLGTIVNDDVGVNLSINNVAQVEGNSGTSVFAFTVSLAGPAPVGGVTFDIATANGTATAGSDYVAQTLTAQTIPSGATSYTFNVVVNGDTTVEPDETFFVNLTNVSGATPVVTQGIGTILTDDILRIHTVQGNGPTSPFNGQLVTVEGIVTADYQGANQLKGFFIQEPDNLVDTDPATSEGVFVFTNALPIAVSPGQLVRVTGTIAEFGTAPNTLTEIITPSATVVSSNNPLPAFVTVALPVATVGDLERYEGMRVRLMQTLTVSDHFDLAHFGEITVTANGRALQPTNEIDPNDDPPSGNSSSGASNVAAINAFANLNQRSSVILDGSFQTYPSTIPFLDPLNNTIRLGSTVADVTGVMSQLAGTHRIYPDVNPVFTYAPRPLTPPNVGGNVKVASMNVLNYFNGDGLGGGFPTSRGADSPNEFNRQRAKVLAAIVGLNADVVGLLEIENDGNGVNSSIQDLVNGLNAATAPGTWAFIPDPANYGSVPGGTDLIRPAIIYKTTVVSPQGASSTTSSSAFNQARAPVAQTFKLLSNDELFTLVVNHFKSKGSGGTGADADQGDGQGFYNNARKLQAQALLSFIATLTPTTPRVIAMGDFNAYEQEDPMDILRAGGLATIINNNYSYLFDGLSGSLDHALGTPALMSAVSGADKWHINADEPVVLDYNVETKNTAGCMGTCTSPDFYAADPFRASDHDPVLVGLQLSVPQCAAGSFSATGNSPCTPASPGNFVPVAGATMQTLCSAGTFQPASGATSCNSAPAGSFVLGTGATMATLCAAGFFQSMTGAASCNQAPAGSFVNGMGATTATLCAVGSFQSMTGATACNQAPAGSFVSGMGATTATLCAAGSFQSMTGAASCDQAPAGSFVSGMGATTATLCAAGTFQSMIGAASCDPAPAGSFVSGTGAITATLCAAGSFQSMTGATSCNQAPAGSFVSGMGATTATLCAAGTFQSVTGATSCDQAPAGSFVSTVGATTATSCAAGSFQSNTGATSCDPAPAGSFVSTVGATTATLCAAGTFQSMTGTTACDQAPAGSFVSGTGATTATLCAAGAFQSMTGATSCNQAPAGSFVSGMGATTATSCAAGSFQPNTGTTSCTTSPAGSFVSTIGATTATSCAAGSFQPNTGATSCEPAPAGSFVGGMGATTATLCAAGSFQPATGQTTCTLAQPGFFVPTLGATTQTMCPMGTTSLTAGATACVALYNVTPTAGANGGIAPSTVQSVAQGASVTFTLTPDAGYTASVTGTCGGTLTGNSYTTNAVTMDCTVVAGFTPPLTLVSVVSRKLHDLVVGNLPVNTGVGQPITVEPRAIGAGHTLVFTFNQPITAEGSVSVVDSQMTPVGNATLARVGSTVEVTITGVPDNQRVTIALTDVNGGGSASAAMGFLVGDFNGTGSVNAADISAVKARSGQPVDTGNFRFDVNMQGGINANDISAVKARSGLVLPQ